MEIPLQRPVRVVIVGSGNVGATTAFALALNGAASEIVLIDANHARAEGDAMDLNHAMPFMRPARVWAGDYADCASANIVILTAGVGQRPGETRLDLLKRNAEVFGQIVPRIIEQTREAVLVIATNPVDVLTHVAWKVSGYPAAKVIGSGTILDTARFRHLLSQRFGVDPRSVHAFVIGEHGDSEVAAWSLANIAGMRLDEFCRLNDCALEPETKAQIYANTRNAAYEIISRKGATFYAIAAGLVRIVEAIVRDEHSVLTVSSLVEGKYGLTDVCLSLPTVVNRTGVARVLELALDESERAGLQQSAAVIHHALDSLAAGLYFTS
ncbi:MAG: L-lactate dehydrogenase [Chloroflexi bacterium]|nr:L-lactate dehydrogenase [Chloroflexota bacterium]